MSFETSVPVGLPDVEMEVMIIIQPVTQPGEECSGCRCLPMARLRPATQALQNRATTDCRAAHGETASTTLGRIAEASMTEEPGAGKTCPEPFVPGPKPWVLEPQDQGDQGRSRRAARRDTLASSVQVCAGAVG